MPGEEMGSITKETITSVRHWNDSLFSFTSTRDTSLKFENGHFVMIGLEVDGKPLMRAYSIVSPNYAPELEFLSIKVPDGPLTSVLQNVKVGDELLVSKKPTGTLVADLLIPGKNLFLLATGTGLAPFLSIIQDPEIYERFENVFLVHGVRYVSELAYRDFLEREIQENEYFGDEVKKQLRYYPTVTREPFINDGRISDLLTSGRLLRDLGLGDASTERDRFMICGGPSMLKQLCLILEEKGFEQSRHGIQAHYTIERAFAEQ
tara:strand:- start:220 stop:1008 length:789 start_codon:yes stop_codon:yes gene_type:complete